MPMARGIKRFACRQEIGTVKMRTGLKDARNTVLNSDLHLARQDKNPLVLTVAVKRAAETRRTGSQLVAAAGKHL